jgi:hypothetical protein
VFRVQLVLDLKVHKELKVQQEQLAVLVIKVFRVLLAMLVLKVFRELMATWVFKEVLVIRVLKV